MNITAVEAAIRRILTAPDVDLSTISSKRVRKELSESFGAGIVKQSKEAIDALIIEAFNEIAIAGGLQEEQRSESKALDTVQVVKAEAPASPSTEINGYHADSSSSKPFYPATGSEAGVTANSSDSHEEEESASSSYSGAHSKRSPKSKPSKRNVKASPQKRRLQETNVPLDSSPSIPLALSTTLTDEEYARQLQAEMNANMRGRETRGGGFQKSASKKGKKVKANNGNTNTKGRKIKSKAYITDSDLSGEERQHRRAQRRKRSDSDEDDGSKDDERTRKKRGGGGGSGGGYNKELALSEPLQKVCGVPTMSRPQIVKQLWVYIREHSLQDPSKRSDIINDDLFKEIFGVERMTMFNMNKYLTKSVSPVG